LVSLALTVAGVVTIYTFLLPTIFFSAAALVAWIGTDVMMANLNRPEIKLDGDDEDAAAAAKEAEAEAEEAAPKKPAAKKAPAPKAKK